MSDILTIFTDAGFDPHSKTGVWAAWAKFRRSDPTMRRSGVLKSESYPVHCNNDAELQAVVNGLTISLRYFNPPAGTTAVIATDSLTAIHALQGGSFNARAQERFGPVVQLFQGLVERRGIRVSLRHVKGHSRNLSTREQVNTWCDRECRALLRDARGAKTVPSWNNAYLVAGRQEDIHV